VTYIKGLRRDPRSFRGNETRQIERLTPSAFFLQRAGRTLRTCQGSGTVTVEMQFLADVELTCEDCRGTRFRDEILDVKYKGKSIAEVCNDGARGESVF
jgi:excinuclease ABC subunit A